MNPKVGFRASVTSHIRIRIMIRERCVFGSNIKFIVTVRTRAMVIVR